MQTADAASGPNGASRRRVIVLRPEALHLHRERIPGPNVLPGHITASSFLGTLARYWVDAGGTTWVVDVPAPGETVLLSGDIFLEIPRDGVHLVQSESML
jgi:hypothetical protein